MNRRGNVMDSFTILATLFMAGIVSIIMLLLVSVVKDDFLADDNIPDEAQAIIVSGEEQLPGIYDWLFVLMFVGLPLVSAIFAYFNNIHPLFFWISLLLSILVVMVGAGYAIFWTEFVDDTDFSTHMERMPMMNAILTNYGKYSLFIFFIIAVGSYFKIRGSNAYAPGGGPY